MFPGYCLSVMWSANQQFFHAVYLNIGKTNTVTSSFQAPNFFCPNDSKQNNSALACQILNPKPVH